MALTTQSLPASARAIQQHGDFGPPDFTVKPSLSMAPADTRHEGRRSEAWGADNASSHGLSFSPHRHAVTGWLTAGRSVFLGIGLALGAHSVVAGYTSASAISLPFREQTNSSNFIDFQCGQGGSNDAISSFKNECCDQVEWQKLESAYHEKNIMHILKDKETTDQIYHASNEDNSWNDNSIVSTLSNASSLGTIQSSSSLISKLNEELHEEQTMASNFTKHQSSESNVIYLPPVRIETDEKVVNNFNIIHEVAETLEEEACSTLLSASSKVSTIIDDEQYGMSPFERMTSENAIPDLLPCQENSGSSVVGALVEDKTLTVVTDSSLKFSPQVGLYNDVSKTGEQRNSQEQAIASLQALKIIEAGIEKDAICTRREYARWLIIASDRLARSPAHKVFPAMYIKNASEYAFDDVSLQDPDFPYIQGLAEAGIIPSNLTRHDRLGPSRGLETADESETLLFLPDRPLSRQDLISWKFALSRHLSPAVRKEELQAISSFIDIDRIGQDAWPALFADLSAGDRSVVALAFGYTRRFQPDKPVTKAQAAIALSGGEEANLVSEKLVRLQAESIAEEAITAQFASESKGPLEVPTDISHLLEEEKAKKEAAERLVESTLEQLKNLKAKWHEQEHLIARECAVVESERGVLCRLQKDTEKKSESLTDANLEVTFEKEKLQKLHREAESERRMLANLITELEVQKKALTIAKSWAEEEAKKAYSHAKLLEAARKRWGTEAVQLYTGKDVTESDIQTSRLQYCGFLTNESFSQKLALVIRRVLHKGGITVNQFKCKASRSFKDATKDLAEAKDITIALVTKKLQQTINCHTNRISSGLREVTWRVINKPKVGAVLRS